MPNDKNKLYLYEALELRSEYKKIINFLETLDESKLNAYGSKNLEPSDEFDFAKNKKTIKKYKFKLRKLNSAIQKANFNSTTSMTLSDGSQCMSLMEALEYRSSLDEHIDDLKSRMKNCAFVEVEYKDSRTVKKEPNESFLELKEELEKTIIDFRELNRAIRAAAYDVVVDYQEEEGTSL